ncbi:ATP adenylyltransferase, partial [Gonapodya prolifera JEL478]
MTNLSSRVSAVFNKALSNGDLIFTESIVRHLEDRGMKFQIRFAPALAKKPSLNKEKAASARPFNPFLPPDPNLLIAEVGQHYNLVLNKFCLVREHVLLCTKAFVNQNILLDGSDLFTLWKCLTDLETEDTMSLAFYNAGVNSGASQPHKHCQIIPVERNLSALPIDDAIQDYLKSSHPPQSPFQLNILPFRHGVGLLPQIDTGSSVDGTFANELAHIFHSVIESAFEPIGVTLSSWDDVEREAPTLSPSTPSFNFLMTRKWMLLVPRRSDSYEGISINSVGYGGMLLSKSAEEIEKVERIGPMNILKELAFPA